MHPGGVRVQRVHLRREYVRCVAADGIEVERKPRLPHQLVAGARHESIAHVHRRLQRDPAAGRPVRADIRQAEIDAELVLGTARGGGGVPLSYRRHRQRQRESGENHPAEELPHTKTSRLGW